MGTFRSIIRQSGLTRENFWLLKICHAFV
jgi:hypothetical protein